jgi:hypothetical protein
MSHAGHFCFGETLREANRRSGSFAVRGVRRKRNSGTARINGGYTLHVPILC